MPLVMTKNEYTYSKGCLPVKKVVWKLWYVGTSYWVTKEVEVLWITQCLIDGAEKSTVKSVSQRIIRFIGVIPKYRVCISLNELVKDN